MSQATHSVAVAGCLTPLNDCLERSVSRSNRLMGLGTGPHHAHLLGSVLQDMSVNESGLRRSVGGSPSFAILGSTELVLVLRYDVVSKPKCETRLLSHSKFPTTRESQNESSWGH